MCITCCICSRRASATATTRTTWINRCSYSVAAWPKGSHTRAKGPIIAMARRAVSHRPTCRRPRSCRSSRTTIRSATARSDERLTAIGATPALEALAAIYLLAPQISLLFMGEEFGASTPFLYFCDFHGELGRAVSEGRRKEFSRFACFGESVPPDIPDPNDDGTFEASRLDWSTIARAPHARWLAHYRELLALRRQHIVPLLPDIASGHRWDALADVGLQVRWQLRDGGVLLLDAQLSDAEARREFPAGRLIYELRPSPDPSIRLPWSVRWAIS